MSASLETKGSDWAEMAKLYKSLTVGVSHRPIATLLAKTNALLPFSEATAIHDNGCGPGLVLARMLEEFGTSIPKDCALSASDFSEAMIEQLRARQAEEVARDPTSPWSRVESSVMDAMDLRAIKDSSQSIVTAGWVYFMTPSPEQCLAESLRVLKPSGVLALSSWQGSQWMDIMNLVTRIRPDADPMQVPDGWRWKDTLAAELEKAGFRDVESVESPVEFGFESHTGLADLLLNKMPQIVNRIKDFSKEEREQLEALTLSEIKRVSPSEPGKLTGVSLVAVGRK